MKKKEFISESRLREIISEETLRMKKRITLESEKKQLIKKLNEMYMEEEGEVAVAEEMPLEEALGGLTDEQKKALEVKFGQMYDDAFNAFVKAVPANEKIRESYRSVAVKQKDGVIQKAIDRSDSFGQDTNKANFYFQIKDRKLFTIFDIKNPWALGAGGVAATKSE